MHDVVKKLFQCSMASTTNYFIVAGAKEYKINLRRAATKDKC